MFALPDPPARYALPILIAMGAVLLVLPTGLFPLFDRDEGAFSEASRVMLESGNYLMPYVNGAPRYDKPILIYWCQAASMALFGVNEFAARFPSALSALCWMLLLWRFGRRHFGEQSGFVAALIFLTAVQMTVYAKLAMADSLLNVLVAWAMFSIYEHYKTKSRRFLYRAAVAVALAVLAKGPIALLIPVVTSFLFAWSYREWRWFLRGCFDPKALLLFFLIALPWPVIAYLDQGAPLLDAWFRRHTLQRAWSTLEGHHGSLFYYVPILMIGFLPYTALLIHAASDIKRHWSDPLQRYLAIWFAFVFVSMSLMGTKLPHYLIYGYTPAFLLMALCFGKLRSGMWFSAPAAAVLLLFLVLPTLLPAISHLIDDAFARKIMADPAGAFGFSYYVVISLCLLALAATSLPVRVSKMGKTCAVGLVVAASVAYGVVPATARLLQEPIKEAALLARERNHRVVLLGVNRPAFFFYFRRPVSTDPPGDGDVVLAERPHLDRLVQEGRILREDTLYEKHGVVLTRVFVPSPKTNLD